MTLKWYENLDTLDHWIVADGPADWKRFSDADGPYDQGAPLDTSDAVVSNVVIDDHHISFKTTAVGVPHLIKVSYFPNWQATGAAGPYRAGPSLMIVVPTQENVSLEFGRTWTENVGRTFTVLAFLFVIGWAIRSRRRRGAGDDLRESRTQDTF